MRKRVCVIGAGGSGLTAIKQLRDEDHEVVCYERESAVGGVFNWGEGKNGVYDGVTLTISSMLIEAVMREGSDPFFV